MYYEGSIELISVKHTAYGTIYVEEYYGEIEDAYSYTGEIHLYDDTRYTGSIESMVYYIGEAHLYDNTKYQGIIEDLLSYSGLIEVYEPKLNIPKINDSARLGIAVLGTMILGKD